MIVEHASPWEPQNNKKGDLRVTVPQIRDYSAITPSLLTHLESSNGSISLLGDIRLVSEEVPNILDAVLNHRRSL